MSEPLPFCHGPFRVEAIRGGWRLTFDNGSEPWEMCDNEVLGLALLLLVTVDPDGRRALRAVNDYYARMAAGRR